MCEKRFPTLTALKQHQLCHSTASDFICDTCGKMFKQRQSLQRHARGHNETRIECDICKKMFTRKDCMKVHMKSHQPKQVCPGCGKSMHNLQEHQKICQKSRSKDYACSVCGKSFLEKRYMREHQRCAHAFEGLFTCTNCNKKFMYRATLLRHMPHCIN